MNQCDAMLAVFRDVYDGGIDLIGKKWTLYPTALLKSDKGPDVLKHYYDMCLNPQRGKWVRRKLEAKGRKTLESERERFEEAYRQTRNKV